MAATAACGRISFDPLDGVPPDASGDPPFVCLYTFCDDFNRSTPLESGWDNPFNSGGAVLALDQESYLLKLPAPELHAGFLEKQLPAAMSEIEVQITVHYGSATPGTAEIDLIQLKWDVLPAPCTSFGYYLVRDGTGPLGLQETYGGCGGNENTPLGNRDNTGPHDIKLHVTFGAIGTARVRVDIDELTLVDKTTSHAIAPSTLTLRVGGGAVRNMSAPWQIRYDDLTVERDGEAGN